MKYLWELMSCFFQHTVVFETAVGFAVIILLTYERLRFIQSCPALFFQRKENNLQKVAEESIALNLFYITASMQGS